MHVLCTECDCLEVPSLELRRLHLDLIFSYKIVFGLLDINFPEMSFTSGIKGWRSDIWWERMWWLWWGESGREWTERGWQNEEGNWFQI